MNVEAVQARVAGEFPVTGHFRKEGVYQEQTAEIKWALRAQWADNS